MRLRLALARSSRALIVIAARRDRRDLHVALRQAARSAREIPLRLLR